MKKSAFPASIERDLPAPPVWWRAIGVGMIVTGLAMGTGELIIWPQLTITYGLNILWLALLGISFQYVINQEVARHALATGESFFSSSTKLIWFLPIIWLPLAILLYIWPGWANALGTIMSELLGFGSYLAWSWFSLFLVLVLTFSGKLAYDLLEKSLKIIVPIFITLLLIISFSNLSSEHWRQATSALFNFGYIPDQADWRMLLGAVVFAGAGGLLNLCVSLWYRDKQAGMGKYVGRISNPVTGRPEAVAVQSFHFPPNQTNLNNWRAWMRFVAIDQGLVFWFLGLLTLWLLSVNAYFILGPQSSIPEGLAIATNQAKIFGSRFGVIGEKIYLTMAYLMLFSVMWAVLDALTRIVSDLIHTNSRFGRLSKYFSWLRPLSLHHLYYALMLIFVIVSAALVPWKQPWTFLMLSSILGGLSMALYTPLLFYLNNFRLPKHCRPGLLSNIAMIITIMFYIVMAYQVIGTYL